MSFSSTTRLYRNIVSFRVDNLISMNNIPPIRTPPSSRSWSTRQTPTGTQAINAFQNMKSTLQRAWERYDLSFTLSRMLSCEELIDVIKGVVGENLDINQQSSLIGGHSSIDSMGLVQICLALEERSQSEGFTFDWTSEKAMSSLNSIFRTVETLTKEYNKQSPDSRE